jgi:hypothetical protein
MSPTMNGPAPRGLHGAPGRHRARRVGYAAKNPGPAPRAASTPVGDLVAGLSGELVAYRVVGVRAGGHKSPGCGVHPPFQPVSRCGRDVPAAHTASNSSPATIAVPALTTPCKSQRRRPVGTAAAASTTHRATWTSAVPGGSNRPAAANSNTAKYRSATACRATNRTSSRFDSPAATAANRLLQIDTPCQGRHRHEGEPWANAAHATACPHNRPPTASAQSHSPSTLHRPRRPTRSSVPGRDRRPSQPRRRPRPQDHETGSSVRYFRPRSDRS